MSKASLGLDFGTESVRAVLVDLRGRELACTVAKYAHGQITESLPGSKKKLPPHYALQHSSDWIESAAKATRAALRQTKAGADDVLGIGVDFTSCTMLPTKRDGTPLCLLKQFAAEPLAWPKLWKHHGAAGGKANSEQKFCLVEVLITKRISLLRGKFLLILLREAMILFNY